MGKEEIIVCDYKWCSIHSSNNIKINEYEDKYYHEECYYKTLGLNKCDKCRKYCKIYNEKYHIYRTSFYDSSKYNSAYLCVNCNIEELEKEYEFFKKEMLDNRKRFEDFLL